MISLCLSIDSADHSIYLTTLICWILRLWKLKLPCLNLPVQVLFVLSKKGQLSREENKQDDAKGPHVSRMAIVITFARDIRVHVVGGPAEQSQFLFGSGFDAEAKIYNLDSILFTWIDQNIVELEISMNDVVVVQVCHSINQLSKYHPAELLRQSLALLLLDVMIQAFSVAHFHD